MGYIAASGRNAGYAERLGDLGFLRDIQRAMASEEETVAKRRTAITASQTAGE